MKKSTWRKHHKWLGIIFSFFLFMFCISGIVLNHRELFSKIDVTRSWLPGTYQYTDWNNGLLKGTLKHSDDSTVFIYGNAGVIKSDSKGSFFSEYNKGMPKGVDRRNIQAMLELPDGTIFALGQFELFKLVDGTWTTIFTTPHERFVDLVYNEGKLNILSRSFLYNYTPETGEVFRLQLAAPLHYNKDVTLFRTIWLIHSGELFGIVGKIVVDLVALILIILAVTGLLYWFLPKLIKRKKKQGKDVTSKVGLLKDSLNWHNRIGVYTIVITLFISFTGWCLRPPLLIFFASTKVKPIPGTMLSSDNPWNDKLRAIRYDDRLNDWLLSTSEGFYSLSSLNSIPRAIQQAPPVSVMGINVMEQNRYGEWIIGSFSGIYIWHREFNIIQDYSTGSYSIPSKSMPFGNIAISGYSSDFDNRECIVDYGQGCDKLPMPQSFKKLPMSLWNLALEVHTGRIYTILGSGTLVYITFAGLIVIWILLSGYKVRKRK